MAVYNCECGLTISTSSVRPRCLRCMRVLGPDVLAGGVETPPIEQVAEAMTGRLLSLGLNERPLPVPPLGQTM